jgi:hypothetical protein
MVSDTCVNRNHAISALTDLDALGADALAPDVVGELAADHLR